MRNRSITKDDVEFIAKNWSTMSVPEISQHLGIGAHQVRRIARELRKQGFQLEKKTPRRISVIKEFIESIKNK